MYNVGGKYMGTGEGSGIPRHLQEQNPSSQCLQMWRTQKFLSPTVPDFSSRFPYRGMMGRWPLEIELSIWNRCWTFQPTNNWNVSSSDHSHNESSNESLSLLFSILRYGEDTCYKPRKRSLFTWQIQRFQSSLLKLGGQRLGVFLNTP